jgi:hypothetical protein
MDRLSRVAFYAGWTGVALLIVFVFLLLFRWIDVPSLAVVLPFAIGYGALELGRRKPVGGKDMVVLTTGAGSGGGVAGSVGRLYRRLLTRGDAKLILPGQPAQTGGGELDAAEWVADQIRRLKTGRMEIDAPTESRVGRQEKVVVAIAKAEHDKIIAAVAEGRQLQVSAIKVNTFMRVELHGDAFDITPPPRVDKVVPDDQAATWEFAIVPKISGVQTLTIHAVVRLRMPDGGAPEYYEMPPVERQVLVRVDRMQMFRRFFARPFVKFATIVWGGIVAIGGFVFGLDPVKAKAGELLKPYLDRIVGLFG